MRRYCSAGHDLNDVGRLKDGACRECRRVYLRAWTLKKGRAYQAWSSMRSRCHNSSHKNYSDYGGRGIKVCSRWDSFENFLADMGHPPRGRLLDRIDNNGNYRPSNCRWATSKTSGRNRNCCKLSTTAARVIRKLYQRGNITQRVLAKRFNVGQMTICHAVNGRTWA